MYRYCQNLLVCHILISKYLLTTKWLVLLLFFAADIPIWMYRELSGNVAVRAINIARDGGLSVYACSFALSNPIWFVIIIVIIYSLFSLSLAIQLYRSLTVSRRR